MTARSGSPATCSRRSTSATGRATPSTSHGGGQLIAVEQNRAARGPTRRWRAGTVGAPGVGPSLRPGAPADARSGIGRVRSVGRVRRASRSVPSTRSIQPRPTARSQPNRPDARRGERMSRSTRGPARAAIASLAILAMVAVGCSSSGTTSTSGTGGQRAPVRTHGAQDPGQGRGRAQHHRLGRLRRERLERPEGQLGRPVRAADRLQGQRQDRQHLRRDGAADEDRRVRRGLGLGRRRPAPHLRRRRGAGQHQPGAELQGPLAVPEDDRRTTRSTACPTASPTAGAPTC